MKKQLTNIAKFLFFLGIGILLIWLAIKDKTPQQLTEIKNSILQANYFWIILSVIISGLSHYFRAVRWKILLAPLGYKPKTSNSFFSVMAGYLFNLGIPRSGEVVRCGLLNQYEKVPFVQGFGTVIAERAIDVICLMILFFLTLAVEFKKISGLANELIFSNVAKKFTALTQKPMLLTIVLALFIIAVAGFFYFRKKIAALMSGKIKGFIVGLWDGLLSVKKVNQPVLFTVYTIAIWLMYILQVYVCFFAFAELSHLSFMVAIVITVFGSVAIIVVPGGTGLYQIIVVQILTTVYLISAASTSPDAFAWGVWVSQIFLIFIAGLASFILMPLTNANYKPKQQEEPEISSHTL